MFRYRTNAQARSAYLSTTVSLVSGPQFPPAVGGPFATDGATVPWYGGITQPAFYDSGLNKTFLAWEAWTGVRSQETTSYDHDTRYFSDIEGMGVSSIANDDHGNPSIILDHENYLHAFYGAHATAAPDMKHSVTRWPIEGAELEGSHWAIQAPIVGVYTYPLPVLMSSTLYLFMRESIPASTKAPLVLYKSTALSNGAVTWGSENTLVDFETDSRFYFGAIIKNGTDIWIVATRSDHIDEQRKGVYLFILDTVDGSIRNYNGSTDTAAASLPINNALAASSYRIFDHGANRGDIPTACFDTNGNFHIVFLDGSGINFSIKHVSISSGVLSSVTTVATIKAGTGATGDAAGYVEGMALVPLTSGEVELWYPKDEAELWDHGGDMIRRVRSAAGTWGSEITVLRADTKALSRPTRVVNGLLEARVVFTEIAQSSNDPATGELKAYLWGSRGFIGYRQPSEATIIPVSDGNELREDGTFELREDNFKELREVAS